MPDFPSQIFSGGKKKKPDPKRAKIIREGAKKADEVYEKEMRKKILEIEAAEDELENFLKENQ